MVIDGNPTEMRAMEYFQKGDAKEGGRIQDEFVAELREFMKTGTHCSCKMTKCKYHGVCVECVALHRGHKHHLPECFRDMVNERLLPLSGLTEHTLK